MLIPDGGEAIGPRINTIILRIKDKVLQLLPQSSLKEGI
jgi:hypothetical protein